MSATRTALLICLFGLAVEVYLLAFDYTMHLEAKGVHQVLLTEFSAGTPVTETFTMGNNGLKGIRIRLAAREPSDVTFDWRLSELSGAAAASTVVEKREQLHGVSVERWVDLRFPAIAQSSQKRYKLEVRAVAPTSSGVAIAASLDDALPGARFEVGGQERWGDLVMDTVATGDTIVGRVLATEPGRKGFFPGVLFAAVGLYNLLLATFVVHFWPSTGVSLAAAGSTTGRQWSGRRTAGIVCLCVVAAGMSVYASRQRRPAIDLIDQFHTAELQASLELHLAFLLTDVVVGGESMRAIAAHPQSEIAWTVKVPSGARLRTAIAMVPMVWSLPGDGVVFRIGVSENGVYSELFAHHLDPARVPADRRWVPVDLDLSQYSGRRIRLIFKTDASVPGRPPDFTYDWARWGGPRLVAN